MTRRSQNCWLGVSRDPETGLSAPPRMPWGPHRPHRAPSQFPWWAGSRSRASVSQHLLAPGSLPHGWRLQDFLPAHRRLPGSPPVDSNTERSSLLGLPSPRCPPDKAHAHQPPPDRLGEEGKGSAQVQSKQLPPKCRAKWAAPGQACERRVTQRLESPEVSITTHQAPRFLTHIGENDTDGLAKHSTWEGRPSLPAPAKGRGCRVLPC